MKTLVISGVNLTEGGPLTVLREVVRAAADAYPDWNILVAVHRLGILQEPRVREIAFEQIKASWWRRVWLEWVGFQRLSRQWRPDVWLSMHDMTPRVVAARQYVYCHNPSPFCDIAVPLAALDWKFQLFRRFYGVLYGCFVHRNDAVIVQQDWIRQRFIQRYGVRRVIVSHPSVTLPAQVPTAPREARPIRRFLYPALPRVFKNHQVLGEALRILERDPQWQGEMLVTLDGSENKYARLMRARYGDLRSLRFVGLQSPAAMADLYRQCDALVFPSMLETWGLPLTEAKAHQMPILAADLPYAHETVGNCDRATFFDPADAQALARLMLAWSVGLETPQSAQVTSPEPPFAAGWGPLLKMILVDDEARPIPNQGQGR